MKALKPLLITVSLLLLWQLGVRLGDIPVFILPAPTDVFAALVTHQALLLEHSWVTLQEMILGLLLGVSSGVLLAVLLAFYVPLRSWLLPLLLISQTVPTFALAPLLMLWLDYGLTSKVVMTALMIFFPVTLSCFDGLRQTNKQWLDLAVSMNAKPTAVLRHIRWPAAKPVLASGLRMAVVIAPIGAVVGEWVGSSAGLGYLMMQANARLWVDQMFAALLVLSVTAITLYYLTDALLTRWIPWHNNN